MLPKKVYNKVLQRIAVIKKDWEEDRQACPSAVPYEVGNEILWAIRHAMREDHRRYRDDIEGVETLVYLASKGVIVSSGYGGYMFPLPEGHAPLPTKEELINHIMNRLDEEDRARR